MEPAPRVIDLEPVYIVAESPSQKLVQQYDRAQKAACENGKSDAVLACGAAAGATLSGIASATAMFGVAGAVVSTFIAGVLCGKELAAVNDCGER